MLFKTGVDLIILKHPGCPVISHSSFMPTINDD